MNVINVEIIIGTYFVKEKNKMLNRVYFWWLN